MPFLFENLTSYQKAIAFADEVHVLIESHRRDMSRAIVDQLSRASLSISLNLAEGNGRWHKADKRQFFHVARGSAFECVPLLTILKNRRTISVEDYTHLYGRLEELSKMISGLIKSTDEAKKGSAA